LFLGLQNNSGTSSYSTSQADNQRPDSLSLPHGLASTIKPTTHFQLSHLTLNPKRVMALRSGPINLSFPHVAWSLFSSTLHLVPKPRRVCQDALAWDWSLGFRVLPFPKPRQLNWPHVPPDSGFLTLLPCWLSHPSLAFLYHCFPPDLLLRLRKCYAPAWATCSAWSWSCSYARYAYPAHRGTHRLVRRHLANQLGHFLLDDNPGQGLLPLGTHPGDNPTLTPSLLPSLSIFLSST
jgi:hypothetical protein